MRTLVRASRIVLLGNKKKSILVDGMSKRWPAFFSKCFCAATWASLWAHPACPAGALYDNKQSAVARQWRAMMLGLTRRMLDILGQREADATVLINWETRRRGKLCQCAHSIEDACVAPCGKLLNILDEPYGDIDRMASHFSFHERTFVPTHIPFARPLHDMFSTSF